MSQQTCHTCGIWVLVAYSLGERRDIPSRVILTGLHFSIHSTNSQFRYALTSLLW